VKALNPKTQELLEHAVKRLGGDPQAEVIVSMVYGMGVVDGINDMAKKIAFPESNHEGH
jgi:hypothetical protein